MGNYRFLNRDLRHQLWFYFILKSGHLFSMQVILYQYDIVLYELLLKTDSTKSLLDSVKILPICSIECWPLPGGNT